MLITFSTGKEIQQDKNCCTNALITTTRNEILDTINWVNAHIETVSMDHTEEDEAGRGQS